MNMQPKKQIRGFEDRKGYPRIGRDNSDDREDDFNQNDEFQSNSSIFKNVAIDPAQSDPPEDDEHNQSEQFPDDHDDECFSCHRGGLLCCCTSCHRAYHQSCLAEYRRPPAKNWQCEHCLFNRNNSCKVCSDNINESYQENEHQMMMNSEIFPPKGLTLMALRNIAYLTCTLCYCKIHVKCSNLPLQLLKIKNYFFKGVENYLCHFCWKGIDAVNVISSQRLIIDQQERQYCFVNAVLDSPIHCCWITQDEILQRKYQQFFKIINGNTSGLGFNNEIQKVISMRAPERIRNLQYAQQLQQLKRILQEKQNNFQNYGSFENFRFLVKWKNNSKNVWEDQGVVFQYLFQLKKFLAFSLFSQKFIVSEPVSFQSLLHELISEKEIEQHIASIGPKKTSRPVLHITFDEAQAPFYQISDRDNKIDKSQNLLMLLKGQKTIEMIEGVSNHASLIQIFSKCINMLEMEIDKNAEFRLPLVTIIITQNCMIKQWQQELSRNCCLLQVLTINQDVNFDHIKINDFFYRYLFYPKFQILLMTYESYFKEWKFIEARVNHRKGIEPVKNQPPIARLVILDDFRRDFLEFSKFQIPETNKLVIINETKDQWLSSQVNSQFPDIEIYKFSFEKPSQRKLVFTNSKRDREQHSLSSEQFKPINQYSKEIQWSQLKRLTFHLYIMSYGLNEAENADDLMISLNRFNPTVFSINYASYQKECIQYVKLFYNLVKDWRKNEIKATSETVEFLFAYSREKIYKRICQLAKMKAAVQQFKNNTSEFPFKIPFKLFIGKQIINVVKWGAHQDYILCKQIIKHGFGNWEKIQADACHWSQSSSSNRKMTKFGDYLRGILKKNKDINSIELIEERSYYCLRLMN